jgi:hypothetical protein
MKHVHFGQPKKSPIAEYNVDTEHGMKFNSTCRPDKVAGYVEHMVKEATEIQLNLSNINRDGGIMVSLSCHPVLKQIWDSPNDK